MTTYRNLITATSTLLVLLGLVILGIGIAEGGQTGIVVGLLFVAAGAGRLYLLRRGS